MYKNITTNLYNKLGRFSQILKPLNNFMISIRMQKSWKGEKLPIAF